jgi:hypothetical protein
VLLVESAALLPDAELLLVDSEALLLVAELLLVDSVTLLLVAELLLVDSEALLLVEELDVEEAARALYCSWSVTSSLSHPSSTVMSASSTHSCITSS